MRMKNQTDTFLEQFLIADRMVTFSSTRYLCAFGVMDVNVAPSIGAVLSAVNGSFKVNRCCELFQFKKSKIAVRHAELSCAAPPVRGGAGAWWAWGRRRRREMTDVRGARSAERRSENSYEVKMPPACAAGERRRVKPMMKPVPRLRPSREPLPHRFITDHHNDYYTFPGRAGRTATCTCTWTCVL